MLRFKQFNPNSPRVIEREYQSQWYDEIIIPADNPLGVDWIVPGYPYSYKDERFIAYTETDLTDGLVLNEDGSFALNEDGGLILLET